MKHEDRFAQGNAVDEAAPTRHKMTVESTDPLEITVQQNHWMKRREEWRKELIRSGYAAKIVGTPYSVLQIVMDCLHDNDIGRIRTETIARKLDLGVSTVQEAMRKLWLLRIVEYAKEGVGHHTNVFELCHPGSWGRPRTKEEIARRDKDPGRAARKGKEPASEPEPVVQKAGPQGSEKLDLRGPEIQTSEVQKSGPYQGEFNQGVSFQEKNSGGGALRGLPAPAPPKCKEPPPPLFASPAEEEIHGRGFHLTEIMAWRREHGDDWQRRAANVVARMLAEDAAGTLKSAKKFIVAGIRDDYDPPEAPKPKPDPARNLELAMAEDLAKQRALQQERDGVRQKESEALAVIERLTPEQLNRFVAMVTSKADPFTQVHWKRNNDPRKNQALRNAVAKEAIAAGVVTESTGLPPPDRSTIPSSLFSELRVNTATQPF